MGRTAHPLLTSANGSRGGGCSPRMWPWS